MVATGKCKRAHAQIRTGIPLQKDTIVVRTEVTRNPKRRILATSRKVSVPITQTFPQEPSSQTPEFEPLFTDHGLPTGKLQKGPSRSVTVRLFANFISCSRKLIARLSD